MLNHKNLGINTFQDIKVKYSDQIKTDWSKSELINKGTNLPFFKGGIQPELSYEMMSYSGPNVVDNRVDKTKMA